MPDVICCTDHTDYTADSLKLAVAALSVGELDNLAESLTLPRIWPATREQNLAFIAAVCDSASDRDVTHCRCECCQRVMERPRSECCQECVDEWTENRAAEERPRG